MTLKIIQGENIVKTFGIILLTKISLKKNKGFKTNKVIYYTDTSNTENTVGCMFNVNYFVYKIHNTHIVRLTI